MDDYAKGGQFKGGQNDLRDHNAYLANLAWGGISNEPVLVLEQDKNGMQLFQADRLACGVWKGNRVAL